MTKREKYWGDQTRIERLRTLYPDASWRDLRNEFPGRSESNIRQAASILKISRRRLDVRRKNLDAKFSPTPLQLALRNRRYELKMSQTDIATKLEISTNAFSRYELNTRSPRLDMLMAWMDILGLAIRTDIVPLRALVAQKPDKTLPFIEQMRQAAAIDMKRWREHDARLNSEE